MAQQDARGRQAQPSRSFEIVALALDQRLGAGGAGIIGPFQQHQRQHDIADALAEQRQHQERDQDRGQRHQEIDEPHDQRVDQPAAPGRDQPEQDADDAGEHG